MPRAVVLSYFELDQLPDLVETGKRVRFPPRVPVYVGSYGVSDEAAELIAQVPGWRYAPVFKIHRTLAWLGRR